MGAFTLCVSVIVTLATGDLSFYGGLFVNFCIISTSLLGLIILIKGFLFPEKVNIFENSLERKRVILGFVLFTGYILIIQYLGFFIASLLFVTSMHIYLSNRKINLMYFVSSCLLSLLITTSAHYIFSELLLVPLPTGFLIN